MKDEIKEILEKFNKEVEKAELTRNPYSSEDKKFKHILVSLSEKHFNIFKDILDYITNIEQYHNENVNKYEELLVKYSNLQEKLHKINTEIEEVKNADMTGGNLYTLIDKLENILDLDTQQENLYRYTPEKGFELVGNDNEKI